MYAVVVTFLIKPDARREFHALMVDNATTSLRDEAGCQQFDVWTDSARAEAFYLYEVYTDRAAFDAHLQSTHFERFSQATSGMIEAKDVVTFDSKLT